MVIFMSDNPTSDSEHEHPKEMGKITLNDSYKPLDPHAKLAKKKGIHYPKGYLSRIP